MALERVGLWLEPTCIHIQSSTPPTPPSPPGGGEGGSGESHDPALNHGEGGPVAQRRPRQVAAVKCPELSD